MLELTRLKRLRLRQHEAFADIVAEAVVETPAEETPASDGPIVENPLETAAIPPTVAS
jgi:hypothetical protein